MYNSCECRTTIMKMEKPFIILVICLVANAENRPVESTCRGISRGRDFVLSFTSNFQNDDVSELHIIVVAFSDNPTTVTISSKRQINGEHYQFTFDLAARGYRRITVPNEFLLDFVSEHSDKVLAVTASNDVSVYGMNYKAFTTDAFLGIPNNQLGMSYVVASVMTLQTGNGVASLLAVIGLHDNTKVDITLRAGASYQGQNYEAGDVISFTIEAHEVVQVLGEIGGDLTGSIIRGDSPIAAYGGHNCANTPGTTCDILSEQLIPVDSWGSKHIYTATGRSTDASDYRIISFFDETVVSVPGFGDRTLNAGEFWEVSLSGDGVISSSLPSTVTQILLNVDGNSVDPSIIQVPSEEQFAFIFGFATPPKSGEDEDGFFNFINIVVNQDECGTVTLNNQLISCDAAVPIPETEYVVLRHMLPKGEGVYFVEQSEPTATSPMSVIVYGWEDDESYGYAAGLSLPSEGRLLGVKPFLVRENGGDLITTTLPCLQRNDVEEENIICRFRQSDSTGIEKQVTGVLVDFVQVICPTTVFYSAGLTTVDVSLDGGETYPYIDTIYVAPQHVLPPKVSVKEATTDFGFLDLTEETEFSLEWDPADFLNEPFVDVSIIITDENEEDGWSGEIEIASNVPNVGNYKLRRSELDNIPTTFSDGLINTIIQVKTSTSRSKRFIFRIIRIVRTTINLAIKIRRATKCSTWEKVLEGRFPLPPLPPCPCSLAQARQDTRYQESSGGIGIFHPGATECYRRDAEGSSAGQQCCYGADNELLVGPPGGGTADAFAPGGISTLKHFYYDVLPWIACCYLSDDDKECETYYKFRPSDDCSEYDPPTPTTGNGDPHFVTLDQAEYSFNAVGEFILLETELHNITLQGRMEQFEGSKASVFTAFVLRGELLPLIQVERSLTNQTQILLDGKELTTKYEGRTVPAFKFGEMQLYFNTDQSRIIIDLTYGVTLTVMISLNRMSYSVDMDKKFKGNTRGLLGNFNDDPTDDLMHPNGTVVSIKSSLEDIHRYFGIGWMVSPSTSLFTYLSSTDYNFYNKPDFVPSFQFPNASQVSQEIRDLCGNSLPCLFDAFNTGSLEFASQTLNDMVAYEQKRETLNKVVVCRNADVLPNGKLNERVLYTNSTYKYICNSGYILLGSDVATCTASGEWVTELPVCWSYWVVFGVPGACLYAMLLVCVCAACAKRKCCSSKGEIV